MSSFQSQVNVQPARAVAGDFASTNPRASVLAGPGGLVAGALGVYVGRFAWTSMSAIDGDNAPAVVNNFGTGAVGGFVHREQQGLITDYLSAASMRVPQGFAMTLMSSGDYWCVNDGATNAVRGQKAYARFSDGKVTFAAASTPDTDGSVTGTIAAATNGFTGSIGNNVLNVTAVSSGTLEIGTIIAGSGVASGSQIVAQLSGTAGGVGTYALSIPGQTVAAGTVMTGSYGTFTAVSGLTGGFGVGDILSGSGGGGVTAGTTITALKTGTGGLGTYIVSPTQTVTSSTINTAADNVETPFYCQSPGAPGDLVKISTSQIG